MPTTYTSRIDIKLPLRAAVSDPELFPVIQNLHNAVHVLNAAFDQTVESILPPRDVTHNADNFSFRANSFWGNIAPGQVMSNGVIVTLKSDGFYPGAYGVALDVNVPTMTLPFGIVLDVDEQNSLILVGWPPAIINTDGISVGDVLYAREDDGAFFVKSMAGGLPGGSDGVDGNKFHPVGYGVYPNQTLLAPNLLRTTIFKT